MKILSVYPAYASGNCDAHSKRTQIDDDEMIVVLQGVEAERLPVGTICFSSQTIEKIVQKLGWKLQTPADDAALMDARKDLAAALERLDAYSELANALERVFSPPVDAETPTLEVVK